MRRSLAFACVLGIGLGVLPDAALAERRAALVIGINDYDEVPDLRKAVGDAHAMAAKLRELGFDVTEIVDAGRRAMNQAIATFAASLADGDMAFIHYSGHGVEIDGENYLLPADVPQPQSGQRDFVKAEAIAMSGLIARIAESGARARVFVIDACRDNPFEQGGVRSVGATRGLARVEAPAGTFILYSAGYRQQALDGLGPDDAAETSVYTRTLLKHLGTPGRTIDDIAQDVRGEVEALARQVGHDQRPAYYDELSARLILVAAAEGASTPAPSPATSPAISPANEAAEAWAATIGTTSPAVLEAFIRSFPGTVYAAMAEARLAEIGATVANVEPAAVPAPDPGPDPAGPEPVAPGGDAGDDLAAEAWRLREAGDDGGAFKLAHAAAEQANPTGMAVLGDLYATGRGVPQDSGEAVRWTRQAAEAGNAFAMTSLGVFYETGLGVELDDAEAARWYRAGAEAGNALGMNHLGYLYSEGRGVERDDVEAVAFYRRSAEAGSPLGMTNLGYMYDVGRGIAEDDVEASRWYRRGAEAGNPIAMVNLGYMYRDGDALAQDHVEALGWFRKAAVAGNTDAMVAVGEAYASGHGVEAEPGEALNWFGQAEKSGNSWGLFRRAALLDEGPAGIEGNSGHAGELAFRALMQSDQDTRALMMDELAGRSRAMIEIVQRLLAKVGAYGGPIDGAVGPATREAIGKL